MLPPLPTLAIVRKSARVSDRRREMELGYFKFNQNSVVDWPYPLEGFFEEWVLELRIFPVKLPWNWTGWGLTQVPLLTELGEIHYIFTFDLGPTI